MGETREVHVTLFRDNGHIMSTDCWCEPSNIFYDPYRRHLVVTHQDYRQNLPDHHLVIVSRRERDRHLPSPDFRASDHWITRVLSLERKT